MSTELHADHPAPSPDQPTAITARAVRRTYGQGAGTVTALDEVDLAVPVLVAVDVDIGGGASPAFVGPSGSGKSTLLDVLAGEDDVDKGTFRIDGTEITGLSDDALTRLRRDRVGFVSQSFTLL